MKKSFLILLIVVPVLQFKLSEAQMNAAAPKNPNSAKACAICHYRWVDTFFVDGRGSDLVDYTAEKVVASPDMCFSCHDGSVADSRARAFQTAQHKTGVPPPEHMRIPDIFPLDEQGRLQCATCHSAHGVPSGADSKETIFMRTSNRNSAMCRMCHPGMDNSTSAGNHPIDTVEQPIPASLTSRYALTGDQKNQLICETCHTAHGSQYESYLIKSGRDSTLCLVCHQDKHHLSPAGEKKPLHVVNIKPIKAEIPQGLIKAGARTGNNGELICQTCHKVHNNPMPPPALLIADNKDSALCLNCHPDKQAVADTGHNLLRSGPAEKNLQGQTVAQAGVCSACHLPHQAARNLAGSGDLTSLLCVSCHSQGRIAEKARLSGTQHPLGVRPQNTPSLPLFNKLGLADQNGKISCATCHDPHQSTPYSADRQSVPNGRAAGSFLRQGSTKICAECHRDKFNVANSKHDLAKVAPQSQNIKNQSPLQSGLCGGCHLVHNAQPTSLWARKRDLTSADAARALCLECHRADGLAQNKIIADYSHPLGLAPAAKGITTSLPLYDKDGKISESGLLSCATCHDPHRWNPSAVSEKAHWRIEGDSRNSFLRMENSPAPKLCADCHAEQAYVRGTDHDLMVSAPASRNLIGQTPSESGTCGVCHLTHNSQNRLKLWARNFSGNDGIMEMMCYTCHSTGGSAENKVPAVATHPPGKLITNAGRNNKSRRNYIPLYDRVSGEPVSVGNISCPACHDAHQWNPGLHSAGNGVGLEGSADNSFLRLRSSDLPCRDCHGPEALYKYLYFHDPGKRSDKNE